MFFFFVGLLCGVIIAQEFPTIPKLRPQINKIIHKFSNDSESNQSSNSSSSNSSSSEHKED